VVRTDITEIVRLKILEMGSPCLISLVYQVLRLPEELSVFYVADICVALLDARARSRFSIALS
jgi:hypothetical protein